MRVKNYQGSIAQTYVEKNYSVLPPTYYLFVFHQAIFSKD